MLENAPKYSNLSYWDYVVTQYIQGNYAYTLIPGIEGQIWEYFKYCLRSQNRYFFQHLLIPVIKESFEKNVYTLEKGTEIFRARSDDQHTLLTEYIEYSQIMALSAAYTSTLNDSATERMKEKLDRGFQGFDADGCGAPPSEKAPAGRCNSEGVAYLYAAQEEHTAVVEIRPYVGDTISIATLRPKRDLRLVNLDFDPSAIICGPEIFYNEIQKEFAQVNKGQKTDYLITQYITSLVEHSGYDGLCFRSSLVRDGTNYVIFQPDDCEAVSSKLCYLADVQYQYSQLKSAKCVSS